MQPSRVTSCLAAVAVFAALSLLSLPTGCSAVFDLFVPKDAMQEVVKTFKESKVYYVYNGTVNKYALQFKISVPLGVSKLQFSWISRARTDIAYSIGFSVDNKLAMRLPQLNISSRGLVPRSVSGFEVNLQCTGAASSEVLVGIHINVSTQSSNASYSHVNSTTILSIYRTKLCTISNDKIIADFTLPQTKVAEAEPVDSGTGGRSPDTPLTGPSMPNSLEQQTGLSGRALLIFLGASAASVLLIAALVAVYFWRSKAAYSAGKSNRSGARSVQQQQQQQQQGILPAQPTLSALTLQQHQRQQQQLQLQHQKLLNSSGLHQQHPTLQHHSFLQHQQQQQQQQQQYLQQSRSRSYLPVATSSGLNGNGLADAGSIGSGYTSCSLPSHQKSISPTTERRLAAESRDDVMRDAQIPWERVTLKCILMEGTFGRLYRATLREAADSEEGGGCSEDKVLPATQQEVLIKTVTDAASPQDVDDFTRNGVLLWGQQHTNLNPLLAATQIPGDQRPHLVYPYPAEGNLRLYLSRCRSAQSVSAYCVLSTQQLLHMAVQIAKGLAHLHRKRIVHSDLACRNCVLTSDYTVRIADASLARDLFPEDYYPLDVGIDREYRPVKWMSVETLADGRFSQAGDIWAFGVTLWELITRCQPPYPRTNPEDMLAFLADGHRLGKPTNCPDQLYSIMSSCWQRQPESRPRLASLQTALAQFHATLSAYI